MSHNKGYSCNYKILNLQMELHELQTEVVVMKPFILEQYLLIKQNQKLVKEQSISDQINQLPQKA